MLAHLCTKKSRKKERRERGRQGRKEGRKKGEREEGQSICLSMKKIGWCRQFLELLVGAG